MWVYSIDHIGLSNKKNLPGICGLSIAFEI